MPLTEGASGPRAGYALGDMAEVRHDGVERLACGKREPHPPVAGQVAGAGEDQIAHPDQAEEGLAARAERLAQARDLGEPAGDQGGAGIEPEFEPVADTSRNGDHVLHSAADLDPD